MVSPLAALSISVPRTKRKRTRSSVDVFAIPALVSAILPAPFITPSAKRVRTEDEEIDSYPADKETRHSTLLPPSEISKQPLISQSIERSTTESEDEDDTDASTSYSAVSDEWDGEDNDEQQNQTAWDEGYSSDCESGETTSSSSSSSSSDDDSDSDNIVSGSDDAVGLGAVVKGSPQQRIVPIGLAGLSQSSRNSLAARLNSFLPQLAAANRELDEERENGVLGDRNMEDVSDEGQEGTGRYIEMNLGLGVLEEKIDDHGGDCSSAEDGDEESDADGVAAGAARVKIKRKIEKGDAMATLMGLKREHRADIRVVG